MTGYRQRLRVGDHLLVADEPASLGGADAGPAPMGYVMSGLAACTAITLQIYVEKKGWAVGAIKVDVHLYDEGAVQRIERRVTFGQPLAPGQRERLLAIADKGPVTKLLRQAATIVTTIA